MKKLMLLVVLLVSSEVRASVISSQSPWGACALPVKTNFTLQADRDHWRRQCDSLISCGISWIKPTYSPLHHIQKDYTLSWPDGYRVDEADSFVAITNEKGLNLLQICWPAMEVRDSAGWWNFWTHVVERYGTGGSMPGLTKPVTHWYICLEPTEHFLMPFHEEELVKDTLGRWVIDDTPYDIGDTAMLPPGAVPYAIDDIADWKSNKGWWEPKWGGASIIWDPINEKSFDFFCEYVRVSAKANE